MQPQESTPFRANTDAAALLDRLQKLRNLLPAFAQETAAARREAARLRQQNTKLQTRLAELEARPRHHDTTSRTDSSTSRVRPVLGVPRKLARPER
jgi:phage shock protein A